MHRAISLLGTGILVGLTLVACGSDGSSGKDNLTDKGDKDTPELEDVVQIDGPKADVEVLDNSFNDENIQVKPGTNVVWTNDGQQDHDIIAIDDDDSWGVEPDDFNAGDVYEHTFDEPGTYHYYCSLHGSEDSGMVGTVVVAE